MLFEFTKDSINSEIGYRTHFTKQREITEVIFQTLLFENVLS